MRRYHGQRPAQARQRAKAAGTTGDPAPKRPETGLGRLKPENRPTHDPYPLTVEFAAGHQPPPLRLSDSNRRYCAFCNRTVADNARVCEVCKGPWAAAVAKVARAAARAEKRRIDLAQALRTLSDIASDVADGLDKHKQLDQFTRGRLDAALDKIRRLRESDR